ncbi:MAG: beta-ketoacyl-ACP synthase III [Chitinophagales bacterium]
MQEVYITKISKYLPNQAVSNEEIEDYLGKINGKSSKAKNIVLRSNKIQQRYYAIDKNGKATHNNAALTAEAIKLLLDNKAEAFKEIELLTAGTSSPDQFMPSHAVMVQGELPEFNAIEVMTASGNCCSGVQGLKYAYINIASGLINKAVCAGSERLSRTMRAEQFEEEIKELNKLEENSYLAFEKDFLRWMLSDGAAAALLSNKKEEGKLAYKINWIESKSYANEVETCMYMAGEKDDNGKLISFKEYNPEEIKQKSIYSIKQDVKLLDKNIIEYGYQMMKYSLEKHNENTTEYDYFLPHLSSYFFQNKIFNKLVEEGFGIPMEKWFTNLKTVGNVGSASPFLMLEELSRVKNLKVGDKLLLMIPESARFAYVYISLTVC